MPQMKRCVDGLWLCVWDTWWIVVFENSNPYGAGWKEMLWRRSKFHPPIQLDGLLLAVAGLGVWCLYAPNATMCGWIVAGCFKQVVEGGVWMLIYIRVNWKAVVWCRSNPPHKLGWTVAGWGRFGLVVFVCTK